MWLNSLIFAAPGRSGLELVVVLPEHELVVGDLPGLAVEVHAHLLLRHEEHDLPVPARERKDLSKAAF